jgi:hypothetical protein
VNWLSYNQTRDKLLNVFKKTNGKVLCNPFMKVIEDELIVGILTETNQFLQINPYEQNIKEDDLKIINVVSHSNNSYYEANKAFSTNKSQDRMRVKTIQNISLETQFYNSFRTKIRILLNDYDNKFIREKVMEVLNDTQYLYKIKIKKLILLLKYLVRHIVSFDTIDEVALTHIREQSALLSNFNTQSLCLQKKNGLCIPKLNLISNEENENIYFARIADELLRYKRIKNFILEPKRYLNINNVEYQIHDDEIILLNSLVFGNYFDDLVAYNTNQYVQTTAFDTAEPAGNIQNYPNDVSLKQQNLIDLNTNSLPEFNIECVKQTGDVLEEGDLNWKNIFPENTKEVILHNSTLCSFYPIIYILKQFANREESVNSIKRTLWKGYEKFVGKFITKIENILRKQGKGNMVDGLKTAQYDFETMIMNEEYDIMSLGELFIESYHMFHQLVLYDNDSNNNDDNKVIKASVYIYSYLLLLTIN